MKTRVQRRSRLQERRTAKDVGGRVQAGSGSSWRAKGDVRVPDKLRMECKYTEKDHYIVKLDELEKIAEEALKGGLEDWAMQVEFVRSHGYSAKFSITSYSFILERMQRTGVEIFESSAMTDSKRARLALQELTDLANQAAMRQVHWVHRLRFTEVGKPPQDYGVTGWQLYLELDLVRRFANGIDP